MAIWDYKNFNSKSFQSDIKEIDWSLATENNDVDLGFETFFKRFSKTLDKHAFYMEIRKENEIETSKPWITKGIKQSIKVGDRDMSKIWQRLRTYSYAKSKKSLSKSIVIK